ncbi:MAG: transporter, partial [Bacteroidota bacterium]|nr:transporter [Bacteroidota bacterium]
KMSWNINAFFTHKNEKSLIGIQQKETDIQQETFLFTNQLSLLQQESETQKTDRLIQSDNEIIRLKEKICAASKVKYENGVITLNDYLKEITAVNQANLNLALHSIQQIANEYNTAQTLGY